MKGKTLLILALLYTVTLPAFSQAHRIVVDSASAGKPGAVQDDSLQLSKVYAKVEVESTYPGGTQGWINFLRAHLTYPKKAERKKIEGTVVVQFIVDKDGTVSDIEAISGPEELKEVSTQVIKESGKWIPARQNGRTVKSYKKQPITFRLTDG
jgi:protein TonB